MPENKIKRLLLPAGLVVGGVTVGSLVAPVGFAAAQSDDADNTDGAESAEVDESTEAPAEGRGGHGGRHGKGLHLGGEAVADTLGLTPEEVRAALSEGQSLADLAAAQGVDVADLTEAMVDAANQRIDEAVAEGKIDEDRAADMKADVAERVDNLINSTAEELRAERQERREEYRANRQERRAEMTATLEEVLGLTGEEIREALTSGSTLAELAAQQGVPEDDLAAALVEDAMDRVDEALAEGRIDEDRASQITDGIEERIDDLIENGRPGRGGREGRGPGHRGHRHGGEQAPEGAPGSEGETVESGLSA